MNVYSSRVGADVDLIFGSDRVDKAGLLPGDVILSRTGSFLTVTTPARVFLGEVIVDYVNAEGRHGTVHFRADLPVMAYRPRSLCWHCGQPEGCGTPQPGIFPCGDPDVEAL